MSNTIFKQCDVHDMIGSNYKRTAAIVAEHGFRGIVVKPRDIEVVQKILKDNGNLDTVKVIPYLDFPNGSMSMDTRAYAIASAFEKGVSEVDVVAPTDAFLKGDLKYLRKDMYACCESAQSENMSIKYILPVDSTKTKDFTKKIISFLAKASYKPDYIGLLDTSHNGDPADFAVDILEINKYINCKFKTYVMDNKSETMVTFSKCGTSVFGLGIDTAANIVYGYRDLIDSKNKQGDSDDTESV